MEIKLELFASPFLSFHSNGSSGVICYIVASNKLLWEHHSWDDYLDISYSIEWLQSIFISLNPPQLLLAFSPCFTSWLLHGCFCSNCVVWSNSRHDRDAHSITTSTSGWKIKSDGVMMKRATLLTQLWKVELEGTNCWQLFAVLDWVFIMRISSVAAKLPTC